MASYANDNATKQAVSELMHVVQPLSLQQRIIHLSTLLLNKPYVQEPLGEGLAGEYNQKPLYRLDSFDCETYVDTVLALALALSSDLKDFQTWMNAVRYRQGKIGFETRNHFTSADWIPNNHSLGIIKDITGEIAGQAAAVSTVYINRQNWYRHLPLQRVVLANQLLGQRLQKWQKLTALAKKQQNVMATITYIPLAKLLHSAQVVKRIPSGAIIFLVLENPEMKKMIGTDNNISHMGFAIWQQDQLYLRAASIHAQRVIDVPLLIYLSKYLRAGMLRGISVYMPATIIFSNKTEPVKIA